MARGDPVPVVAEADIGAFFRQRLHVPTASCAALISSLSRLCGSDDPRVTFSRLPEACVPEFADGCQVELSDGAEPPSRVVRLAGSADDSRPVTVPPVGPEQVLVTPFRAVSLIGYPSYAGVVTCWWTARQPSANDAVIADLIVKYLVALVEQERLTTAVARAEDRAANLALASISGHTISLATGIVMHQIGLTPDDAEDLLRQAASTTGGDLHQVAADVVRSRSLRAGPARRSGARRRGPLRPAH
jgi:hypothetical protein